MGSPPLGFAAEDKKLNELEDELAVVEYIRSLKRKRLSLRQIVSRLSDEGISTKRGGSWHPGTVRYILQNARYKKRKAPIAV